MDIHEYLGVLRRGAVLILIGIVLGLAGGYVAQSMEKPSYSATSRELLTNKVAGDLSMSQSRIASYVLVASSALVLQPVIDELQLDTTVDDLAQRVSVVAPPDTVIIEITTTASTPEEARDTANTISRVFGEVVADQLETTTGVTPTTAPTPTPGATAVATTAPTPTPTVTTLPNGTVVPITPPTAPVRVVNLEQAALPEAPNPTVGPLMILVGGVLGLALGLLAASLREAGDRRVRGPRDIARVTGVPVVGAIVSDRRIRSSALAARAGSRSASAESFRALRAHVDHLRTRDGRRLFVLTAAGSGQGTTTVAANLAIAIANTGTTVAVVDADLRRPRLSALFDLGSARGLSEVLAGRLELDAVVRGVGTPGLTVVPAGPVAANAGELLATTRMRNVLIALGRSHEVVIVDTPTIASASDAAVLGGMTGSTLLIVAQGATTRPRLDDALALLEAGGSEPIGIVMTRTRGPVAGRMPHTSGALVPAPAPAPMAPAAVPAAAVPAAAVPVAPAPAEPVAAPPAAEIVEPVPAVAPPAAASHLAAPARGSAPAHLASPVPTAEQLSQQPAPARVTPRQQSRRVTQAAPEQPAPAKPVATEKPAERVSRRVSTPVLPAPVAQAPVAQAPVAQAPVAQAPVDPAPVAPAPVAQAPVEPTPVAKPVAAKAAEAKPAAAKPAAEKPAVEKPAASKPAAPPVTEVAHPIEAARDLDFAFAALPTATAAEQRLGIQPDLEDATPIERPIVIRPDAPRPASRFAPDPTRFTPQLSPKTGVYDSAAAPAAGTEGKVPQPQITGTVINTVSIRLPDGSRRDQTVPPPIRHILPRPGSTIPPRILEAARRADDEAAGIDTEPEPEFVTLRPKTGPVPVPLAEHHALPAEHPDDDRFPDDTRTVATPIGIVEDDDDPTAETPPPPEPDPATRVIPVAGSLLGEIGGLPRIEVRAARSTIATDTSPNPERVARESYEQRARELERVAHERLMREQQRLAVSIREQLAHDKRELESVLDNRLEDTVLHPRNT
jgi:succinoglycan biosynthesis transport protein ExoP